MSGHARKHLVDGKWTTVAEVAAKYGLKPQQIYTQMSHKKIGLQVFVNLYRENQIGFGDFGRRHMVEGQWMSVRQAAALVGTTPNALEVWRSHHRDGAGRKQSLAEGVAHYRRYQTGEIKQHEWKKYWVRGRRMTIQEAGAKYGVNWKTLRNRMYFQHESIEKSLRHFEEKKKRQAEAEILRIIMGE